MKYLLHIIIITTIVSLTVTISLQLIGLDNTVVIGGGVSGGIIGTLSVLLLKKRNIKKRPSFLKVFCIHYLDEFKEVQNKFMIIITFTNL